MRYSLFLFFVVCVFFAFCAKPAPKVVNPKNAVKTPILPLATRLAQYPFSESTKVELVVLAQSEFADVQEKKARDSTGCNCKSVFSYPLKDIIKKKTVLNAAQIDTLTAILFQTDTASIGQGKGLIKIQYALFFYDKNQKLFARLYIDTQLSSNWTLYKNKTEVDFVRPVSTQMDVLKDFITNISK